MEETFSRVRVFAWRKQFVEGRKNVKNQYHRKEQRFSNFLKMNGRHLTVIELASEVEINNGGIFSVITDEFKLSEVGFFPFNPISKF